MANKFGQDFVIVGTIGLVKGRIQNFKKITEVDSYLDSIIKEMYLLKEASFLWIGLILRYGIKNNLKLEFQRIDKKDGELPIALELDMKILQWADQNNIGLLYDIFMIAALEALIQVGQKYKLPIDVFIQERSKYGTIPNTIEECKSYERPLQ